MAVYRITNPAAQRSSAILAAIKRALGESGFERDLDAAAKHLLACCADPHLGLWIDIDAGEGRAVVACSLPNNPLAQNPEIFINANWGPPPTSLTLIRAAVEFVKSAGYNKLVAWNRTGRPDAVFARRYRSFGSCRPLGTMWEFTEAAR